MTAETRGDHAPDPALAQTLAPNISATALLEEVNFPLSSASTVRVVEDGDKFVYTIVTQSPNAPESLSALEQLRERGCTVAMDHESMENFSVITVRVPSMVLRPEQIEGIRREIAERAARTAEMAAQLPDTAVQREILDPAESC